MQARAPVRRTVVGEVSGLPGGARAAAPARRRASRANRNRRSTPGFGFRPQNGSRIISHCCAASRQLRRWAIRWWRGLSRKSARLGALHRAFRRRSAWRQAWPAALAGPWRRGGGDRARARRRRHRRRGCVSGPPPFGRYCENFPCNFLPRRIESTTMTTTAIFRQLDGVRGKVGEAPDHPRSSS